MDYNFDVLSLEIKYMAAIYYQIVRYKLSLNTRFPILYSLIIYFIYLFILIERKDNLYIL